MSLRNNFEDHTNEFFDALSDSDFEYLGCPFCQTSTYRQSLFHKKTLRIERCDCGMIYNSRQPKQEVLEKFYKETEHGLTPDDIGFEIIIPDDKVDTQDDPDSTVVVPTTITTTPPPGGGGAGDAGGGGWDWGGYGSGGYGNYGGNVYNITYGNRGYEQRIDPWAYGMVQWRI